jgi:hypothetical protein
MVDLMSYGRGQVCQRSPGDVLMTRSTSALAFCCSNASSRSRLSSAFFVLALVLEGLRRPLPCALGRLSFAAFRRRLLIVLLPALERRRITSPMAQDKAS